MSSRAPRILTALGAVAALALGGCGSDEPKGKGIPAATARQLDGYLTEIDRRYRQGTENDNRGACADIQTRSFRDVSNLLSGLPSDVDPDVRKALDDSFSRLQTLTEEGCADAEQPSDTETQTTPAPEPQTVPDETTTQQTETQPQDTTPIEQPKKQKKPKDDGSGGTSPGQGNGGGGGAAAPEGN